MDNLRDIESWLTELELEKYVPEFLKAEIEIQDLRYLSDEDLTDLGLPMGPRRRISAAIQQLFHSQLSQADNGPHLNSENSGDETGSSVARSQAQRRHLTVMFIDLVGSTEMAVGLDPEDVRKIITTYQETVSDIVGKYGGYVAKFMGDGVLCYFGWPHASEHDAERAVRVGLEVIESVARQTAPDGSVMATRVGIASGIVVVGDLIGSGAAQEAAVVGETPNLAARLQGVAKPNQVVLPHGMLNLLGNRFELEALGMQKLKGIQEPVAAYAVISMISRESRFDTRQPGALTPIVGREVELASIEMCWASAISGAGKMVVVNGEAGIGKSRIVRAVVNHVARQDHFRVTLQCSPYHVDSAFFPIIQNLTLASKILPEDSNSKRLQKLKKVTDAQGEALALFALLMGIDGSELCDPLELTPAQIRTRTMNVLVQQILTMAQDKPVLIILEDLHWMDPTAIELMDLLLEFITDQPVMILGTARPEFKHKFGGTTLVRNIVLNRLGPNQIAALARGMAGGKKLPNEALEVIANRTDGVPLFVEELTKTMLDTGVLKPAADGLIVAGRLSELAIPSTLHDSLMARLDRLQSLKEVAQTASCIGREFEYKLLKGISNLSESALNRSLQALIKAELIYKRGLPPEAVYHFRHALVRDAAYESMLKESRTHIHARIGTELSKSAKVDCELLAYHAESAGELDRAIELWKDSAHLALARPAYHEAISHLERVIELIEPRIADGDAAVLQQALYLQVQLGVALFAQSGYGARKTREAFEKALTLVDRVGDTPLKFTVYSGLWVGRHVRAEHRENVDQANSLIQLAQESQEDRMITGALRTAGVGYCMTARFEEAQALFDKSLEHYEEVEHEESALVSGQDTAVTIYSYMAINDAILGQTVRAREFAHKAIQSAISADHAHTLVYGHFHVSVMSLILRDEAEFRRHVELGIPLAEEHKLTLWIDFFRLLGDLVRLGRGKETAIAEFHANIKSMLEVETRVFLPLLMIEAGGRILNFGRIEEASNLAEKAEHLIRETGETCALALLRLLQSDIEAERDNTEAAESRLRESISISNGHGGKTWELRAACQMAEMLRARGCNGDAVELLQPLLQKLTADECVDDRLVAEKIIADHAS